MFSSSDNNKSKKRVRFGSSTVETLERDPSFSADELWYRGDALKTAMRNDIIHMLKVHKMNQLRLIGQCLVNEDEHPETDEDSTHTSRGLEAYQPGQLYNRRNARRQFSIFVLSNYEVFQEICDTPEEVEEELENYSSALSQAGKEEAQRMAHEDAIEAQMIYADLPKEFSFSTNHNNNDSRCALTALVKLNSETDLVPFRQAEAA